MKRLLVLFVLSCLFLSFEKSATKVFIFVKEESPQMEFMMTNEVGKMIEILKQSGFEVTTATISGKEVKAGTVTFKPDLKLSDVKIEDYAGFLFPCMVSDYASPEVIAFAREAVNKGKPVAAQAGGVVILAKAGLLYGKKYTLNADAGDNPDFKGGIYNGTGVVQDGIILTSGVCPWIAKETSFPDGTAKLSQTLIDLINGKLPVTSEIGRKAGNIE